MMELILIAIVALVASGLTLFSGFGLGTLLLPVFALLFPLDTAVAATAVVHLANNVWKALLVGRPAVWPVVARFGLPALLGAAVGAWVLGSLEAVPWHLGPLSGTWLGTVLGVLIVGFALFDLVPRLQAWTVGPRWLPLGGLLSGWFGGLSGHQGALRSAFLVKVVQAPAPYVATGVWCAIMVDIARLVVYGGIPGDVPTRTVTVACLAALVGALVGKRLLGKVTMQSIRWLVGAFMVLTGALMALGIAGT